MWWVTAALAGQVAFEVDRDVDPYLYTVAWRSAATRHELSFALPAAAVAADRAVPREPDLRALAEGQARALRTWKKGLKGVALEVRIDGDLVRWTASGTDADEVARVLREATDVAEAEKQRWLAEQRVFVVERNALAYDHAALAVEYTDDVAAIATGVSTASDVRAWAADALAFVQAIPYETRGDGGDLGYRRPLALLDRNRGDCDSKATLYLAMLRARFPSVGSAMVYVPNHALVALHIPHEKGDDTVRIDGEKWVLAEPVGPRETAIGEAPDGHAREARRGVIRRVEDR